MRQELTHLVFILDRSGSMQGLEKDTIGGFNATIEKQKKEPGEAVVTTVLFDDHYELLHNGVDIKEVQPLTEKEYFARGMTALLDAVGKTINEVAGQLNKAPDFLKPGKVMFVITTDGMENASSEFSHDQIKKMIDTQKEKFNWEFLFLGANIDASKVGGHLGISGQRIGQYQNTSKGISGMYMSVNSAVTNFRSAGFVQDNWNEDLKAEADNK